LIADASERQVARSLVYPTDTCFSRALGQSEKIVCAANSASTTAQWTYYSDASCTTVSATPAVSLTVRLVSHFYLFYVGVSLSCSL
jgi:hypothetical protein